MALGAYLTILPERHPPVRGSVTQKGREGKIMVHAVSHSIVAPRDPASGKPTGKRAHKPLTCTKDLDQSSPVLYALLTGNENIREALLEFWTTSPTGVEKQHYTVRLVNATISGITFRLPNTRNPRLAKLPELEEVSFTYQSIEWTWNEGNITAVDNWEVPR
jgi:type VI secretion system secreted protein Hcp